MRRYILCKKQGPWLWRFAKILFFSCYKHRSAMTLRRSGAHHGSICYEIHESEEISEYYLCNSCWPFQTIPPLYACLLMVPITWTTKSIINHQIVRHPHVLSVLFTYWQIRVFWTRFDNGDYWTRKARGTRYHHIERRRQKCCDHVERVGQEPLRDRSTYDQKGWARR